MKILHISADVHKSGGGTSEVIPRMCRALKEGGHDVTLAVIKSQEISDTAHDAIAAGVGFVAYEAVLRRDPFLFSPAMRKGLKELVSRADIVHLHGLWQAPLWYGAWECLRQGKPYVVMPHGFLEPERLKKSRWIKRIVGSLIELPNLNRANAVIATAESEKAGIAEFGVTVPIEVVPLGLDTGKIDAAHRDEGLIRRLGLDSAKRTLLYFSRLTPIKGLDMLADAWSSLGPVRDGWQLLIAGPDDRGYAETVKAYYRERVKDGSVVFSGPIYGADKYTLLKSVDAFVLPTRSENWSIAVQEALAAGLPTVCTKGAPWQIIERYGAGKWVDINADAIKAGLIEVLSATPDSFVQMSAAGKRLIADNFGWQTISERLADTYRREVS